MSGCLWWRRWRVRLPLPVWVILEGATMHEFQIGHLFYLGWCHLKGGVWDRRPWWHRRRWRLHGPIYFRREVD